MPAPLDSFDDVAPALHRLHALPVPVADALRHWRGTVPAEEVLHVETDPRWADTDAFVEHYGAELLPFSANCVVVAGKRGGESTLAACLVPSAARVDVNGTVRRQLGARKASFAAMDTATGLTGMEHGGITPVGLPADWALLVDPRLLDLTHVLLGSGLRRGKLIMPGKALAELPGAVLVDGLGRA
ncbi:YbaK/EbsC family protein [Streptomyces sp. NPDC002454]|uniref:YbaK/EbsC family protein n=1 Tax=unclassified Streptomyces TaxID=2593676 RepID=UPI00332F2A2C